jgi:hypothetical protein
MSITDRIKSLLDNVGGENTNEDENQPKDGGNKMSKKELILKTLEKMGFSPEMDSDGDIMLCYQMKHIYVMMGDEDEPYVSVMLPQFHEIDEGQETLVMVVCNKMTRELKLAKVYIDQTFKNVTATCEFFYANEESLEQNLRNSLQMLGVVRTVFRNNLAELSED